MNDAAFYWIAGFTAGVATAIGSSQSLRRWERRQANYRADGKACHRRARGFYSPSPATIAECGGPCEHGFEYCDCGLFEKMNPSQVVAANQSRTPAPIPLSERQPTEADCDKEGRCWVWNQGNCFWWEIINSGLISFSHDAYTHWLPHWALPMPAEVE